MRFDELPDDVKEQVIDKNRFINVEHNWWEPTIELWVENLKNSFPKTDFSEIIDEITFRIYDREEYIAVPIGWLRYILNWEVDVEVPEGWNYDWDVYIPEGYHRHKEFVVYYSGNSNVDSSLVVYVEIRDNEDRLYTYDCSVYEIEEHGENEYRDELDREVFLRLSEEIGKTVCDAIWDKVEKLKNELKNLMDMLREDYEYLTSDEAVAETLKQYEFDEEGNIIS